MGDSEYICILQELNYDADYPLLFVEGSWDEVSEAIGTSKRFALHAEVNVTHCTDLEITTLDEFREILG